MSATGRYIWNEHQHRWVKQTEMITHPYRDLRNGVWWPTGESRYYDRQAARVFHSKSDKAAWMRQHKLIEHTPTWKNPLKGLAEQGDWKPTRHRGVLYV